MSGNNQHQTVESLLDALADDLHGMSTRLQLAARYIVDHPAEVGVNSMRKLADLANVTPNTLTRLAKSMGFESYEEFRNVFRDAVRLHTRPIPDRVRWLQSIGEGSGHALVVSQMAQAILLNIEQLYSSLDAKLVETIAKQIIAARNVFVVGVRGSYSLAHNFYYVARMALPNLHLVPRQASNPLDDLIGVCPDDLVLAISLAPYASETVEATYFARDRGAKVVAITDSRGSPLARGAAHVLIAPSGTPQFFNSIVGTAAVLETLLAMIVALGDERMLASIRLFDRLRNERKAYWSERNADD